MIDKCVVCGSDVYSVIGHKHDRTIVRCDACQLVRTLDPPTDYETLYTDGDSYHVDRKDQTPYRERYEHDIDVAALRFPKLLAKYRALDVGCANGGFIKYLAAHGATVEGLEPNPHIAVWAAEHTGCPVHTCWDTVVPGFDIITYHDVIEHVVDPYQELIRIRAYLNNSGLLVLDTPDADDPRFQELGMEWHHMKPREHLWFFTDEHLCTLLTMAGFDILDVDKPIQGKLVVYGRRK